MAALSAMLRIAFFDRGTTRVRRYVVRTPVEESVTLRHEQVTIERRRPIAPGTPGVPEGAFEEVLSL